MEHVEVPPLPVELVFHPSWWHKHTGITFDEDFFYHPLKRVEAEQRMERELYDRFGEFHLGESHGKALPVVGAVHNAAGYLLSEMLGCEVRYEGNTSPQVVCAAREAFDVDPAQAMRSAPAKRLMRLVDALKARYGYACGDVNWGGILNLAIDLRGEAMLMDMMLRPEESQRCFQGIAEVIEQLTAYVQGQTGTSSISVNRIVRHFKRPVFLHSECTHTMISEDLYEQLLLPTDIRWSSEHRPFGIHYCGKDPHRFAASFAKIPHLDFLDVGWGGDVKALREQLPNTFFSIRLDPVTLNATPEDALEATIRKLVADSGNLALTGICCINMDDKTDDAKIRTIFKTVEALRA
jgi:uroporphyrinogen-III decarboxylase